MTLGTEYSPCFASWYLGFHKTAADFGPYLTVKANEIIFRKNDATIPSQRRESLANLAAHGWSKSAANEMWIFMHTIVSYAT